MDNLREHQIVSAEALKILKSICDDNNIRYFLLAGTCLGAVRHKGFIPWDDDIDIGILNEDYDRLDHILAVEIKKPYSWISNTTDINYPRLFGKIIHNGVACIDLFRIIQLPKDNKKVNKIWFARRLWLKIYYRKCNREFEDESLVFRILSKLLSFLFSRETIVRMCRKNEDRYDGGGDYLNLYSIYGLEKEKIKREWIDFPSTVEFEGEMYRTVGDTDAYLTHLYGDYMTLPPEKDRVHSHDAKF